MSQKLCWFTIPQLLCIEQFLQAALFGIPELWGCHMGCLLVASISDLNATVRWNLVFCMVIPWVLNCASTWGPTILVGLRPSTGVAWYWPQLQLPEQLHHAPFWSIRVLVFIRVTNVVFKDNYYTLLFRHELHQRVTVAQNTKNCFCSARGDCLMPITRWSCAAADACMTGVLTFNGNRKVKEKVIYECIHTHLQGVYGREFKTFLVQFCIARNDRRCSAEGVAKVTTRQAWKGFTLKFNPDSHWLAALNWLQFTDGSDIININRDDASGFRSDTMVTHSQHASPMVVNALTSHCRIQ